MGFELTQGVKDKIQTKFHVVRGQTINLESFMGAMNTYFEACTFTGTATGKSFINCVFDECMFNCSFQNCNLTRAVLIGAEIIHRLNVEHCFMVRCNIPLEYREGCTPNMNDLPTFDAWRKTPNGRYFMPGMEELDA